MSQIVRLNVGGRKYATSRQTLTRDPDSMLARMFSDDWDYSIPSYKKAIASSTNIDSSSPPCCSSSTVDGANGDGCGRTKKVLSDQQNDVDEHFIDRDGEHFRFILNFLRDGPSVSLPLDNAGVLHELLREAEYYQLQGLIELLRSKLFSPLRSIKNGEIVKWRSDAVEYYWRPVAIALATEGIEFAFLFDKIGRKYNDKQTVAMCFGCCEKFLIDQITVFDYIIRFEEWEALKQHMRYIRGTKLREIGDTCCIVEWANRKIMHVPLTAIAAAD